MTPGDVEAGDDYILAPLERLSSAARRLKCTITIREPGEAGGVLARIEPSSYDDLTGTLFVVGETSLTGKVVRVGGATAWRCGLRVPFQPRLLICGIDNTEVARRIGACLYQDIVVTGEATWLKKSWKLYSFTIKTMSQGVKGTIAAAMEALREAGGKDWDSIEDPAAYLDEVNIERSVHPPRL